MTRELMSVRSSEQKALAARWTIAAEAMEALEITALASLGLADPYGDREEI